MTPSLKESESSWAILSFQPQSYSVNFNSMTKKSPLNWVHLVWVQIISRTSTWIQPTVSVNVAANAQHMRSMNGQWFIRATPSPAFPNTHSPNMTKNTSETSKS